MKLLLSIFLMILAHSNGLPGGAVGTSFGVGDGGQFSDESNGGIQDQDANDISNKKEGLQISNSSSSTDESRLYVGSDATKAAIDGLEGSAVYCTSEVMELDSLQPVFPVLNRLNPFEYPSSISHASLPTPTRTKKPTLDQMMYYNYYAVSAYCSFEKEDFDCYHCEKLKDDVKSYKILNNSKHRTRALVTLSEKREEIVVTYRGTNSIRNLLQDFQFFNAKVNGTSTVRIHKGFYSAAMSLYKDVVEVVQQLRSQKEYSKYKIVIVGHSLGAAMARVTEYLLLALNQFPGAVYEVYGYGEPRSGNKEYVDYLNNQSVTTARIIHSGDIVPHVPPTSALGTTLLIGDHYLHTGTEYWVKPFKQRFCSESVYEDAKCSDSLGPFYHVVHHLNYFGVDYVKCAVGLHLAMLEIPSLSNITEPNEIPPLPEFISSFTGGATD